MPRVYCFMKLKDYKEGYNVFESALEIPEPWYVFHHELAKEEKTLLIYFEYRKGAEFSCSNWITRM